MKIRIVKRIPVWKSIQPTVGEVYEAKEVSSHYGTRYDIQVNGQHIFIIPGECEVVSQGEKECPMSSLPERCGAILCERAADRLESLEAELAAARPQSHVSTRTETI